MPDPLTPTYRLQILSKLWQLLQANPLFTRTFKSGNQQTFTSGIRWPQKPSTTGAADLPWISARLATWRMEGYEGQGSMKTFANIAGGTAADFIINKADTYELTAIYSGVDENLPAQIESEIEAILVESGDKLGNLSFVKSWGPFTGRQGPQKNQNTGGVLRIEQVMQLTVNLRLRRSDYYPA
jgi:hypothetical protein